MAVGEVGIAPEVHRATAILVVAYSPKLGISHPAREHPELACVNCRRQDGDGLPESEMSLSRLPGDMNQPPAEIRGRSETPTVRDGAGSITGQWAAATGS